jgi:Protein of unknown function (DUF664)
MRDVVPGWQIPTNDERELLLWFLDQQRQKILQSIEGLNEEQARWTPDGRLLPLVGIVNHLTEVQWRWVNARYLQEQTSPEGARPGSSAAGDPEFHVDDSRTVEQVVQAYKDRAASTAEIVRRASNLDVSCPGTPDQPYRPGLYLRWVILHLIEETAQHAGHADSTRELLDAVLLPG